MTSGLTVVIAISTAVAVLVVTFLLTKLVRTVAETSPREPSDRSLLERIARSSRRRRPAVGPPVLESIAAPPGVAPSGESAVEAHSEQQPETAVAPAAAVVKPESPSPRRVGNEVTAVLSAAEQAAAHIRAAALHDADEARRAAQEQVAVVVAEAETRRAEADAYAEEIRRHADEQAATTLSRAEERAQQIRAEAEQKATEIEAEALRRREALERSLEEMEERLESMLGVFRRGTSELEGLLRREEHEELDEALNAEVARAR